MHPEASEQDKPAEDGLQQQGAAGPAPGEQQEAGAQAKGVPPIPSCYRCRRHVQGATVLLTAAGAVWVRSSVPAQLHLVLFCCLLCRELPQVPDAPYRLLHSLSNAHGGQAVNSVRFDPTGRRLASGGSDGTAAIWDPQSGVLLHRLKGHTAGISGTGWCAWRAGRALSHMRHGGLKSCSEKCKATRRLEGATGCLLPHTARPLLIQLPLPTFPQTWPGRTTAAMSPPPRMTRRCASGMPRLAPACGCSRMATHTGSRAAPSAPAPTCWWVLGGGP